MKKPKPATPSGPRRHQDINNVMKEELSSILPALLHRYFDLGPEVRTKPVQ